MKKNYKAVCNLSLILFSAGVLGIFSTTYAADSAAGPIAAEFVEPGTYGNVDMDAPLQVTQAQQPMRSRQIIEEGTRVEVAGMLKRMATDGWYFAVDQVLHQIYFAPSDFLENADVPLKEGKEAIINGYFLAEEGEMTGIIAVNTIMIDGKEFRFREDDGTPLWRGRGSGGSSRQPN